MYLYLLCIYCTVVVQYIQYRTQISDGRRTISHWGLYHRYICVRYISMDFRCQDSIVKWETFLFLDVKPKKKRSRKRFNYIEIESFRWWRSHFSFFSFFFHCRLHFFVTNRIRKYFFRFWFDQKTHTHSRCFRIQLFDTITNETEKSESKQLHISVICSVRNHVRYHIKLEEN